MKKPHTSIQEKSPSAKTAAANAQKGSAAVSRPRRPGPHHLQVESIPPAVGSRDSCASTTGTDQRPALSSTVVESQRHIPLSQLRPSERFAVRKKTVALDGVEVLAREDVQDLIDSYKELGRQHTPIMVMPADPRMCSFEIICGHRRFSAHHWHAKDLGLNPKDVLTNCTLFENLPEEEAVDLVYSENRDRRDINLWEKLQAAHDMDVKKVSRDRILRRMGWTSNSMLKMALRIVRHHTEALKQAIAQGLSFRIAYCIVEQAILGESFPQDKVEPLIKQAQSTGLSQTQLQKRIEQLKGQASKRKIEPVKAQITEGKNHKLRGSFSFDPSKHSAREALQQLKLWGQQIKDSEKLYKQKTAEKHEVRYKKEKARVHEAKAKKLEKAKELERQAIQEAAELDNKAKQQKRDAIQELKTSRPNSAQTHPENESTEAQK